MFDVLGRTVTALLVVACLCACSSETHRNATATATQPTAPGNPTPAPPVTATASTPAQLERGEPGAAGEQESGPGSRASAAPVDLASPTATFSDGLAVSVTSASQATQEGQGPGEVSGERYTVFDLDVRNASTADVDTSRVVVSATYGEPPLLARPVYTEATKDLSGTLAPGASSAASYAFAIPTDQLGRVTLSLDIDGRHGLAVFTGKVPQ